MHVSKIGVCVAEAPRRVNLVNFAGIVSDMYDGANKMRCEGIERKCSGGVI